MFRFNYYVIIFLIANIFSIFFSISNIVLSEEFEKINLDETKNEEKMMNRIKMKQVKKNYLKKQKIIHQEKYKIQEIQDNGFNNEQSSVEITEMDEDLKRSKIVKKNGILVVPGLGRIDRLEIVLFNIKLLVSGNYIRKKEEIKNNNININNNDNNNNHEKKENKNEEIIYENTWDCIIYIYADKNNKINNEFWGKTVELDYLRSYCDIIENPNKMVTENLFLFSPKNLEFSYNFIFILLDDCKLIGNNNNNKNENKIENKNNNNNNNNNIENDTFDLSKILRIIKFNNLTIASPMVSKHDNNIN